MPSAMPRPRYRSCRFEAEGATREMAREAMGSAGGKVKDAVKIIKDLIAEAQSDLAMLQDAEAAVVGAGAALLLA